MFFLENLCCIHRSVILFIHVLCMLLWCGVVRSAPVSRSFHRFSKVYSNKRHLIRTMYSYVERGGQDTQEYRGFFCKFSTLIIQFHFHSAIYYGVAYKVYIYITRSSLLLLALLPSGWFKIRRKKGKYSEHTI